MQQSTHFDHLRLNKLMQVVPVLHPEESVPGPYNPGTARHLFPCMMIPEAKSTFSFLFDSVVQYIQILWDF